MIKIVALLSSYEELGLLMEGKINSIKTFHMIDSSILLLLSVVNDIVESHEVMFRNLLSR